MITCRTFYQLLFVALFAMYLQAARAKQEAAQTKLHRWWFKEKSRKTVQKLVAAARAEQEAAQMKLH